MDGKSRRSKGAVGEREVASIFREHGLHAERWRNGLTVKGDIRGIEGFHLEVKRQERLKLHQWLRQAREEAAEGDVPTVIFRQNRETWTVALPLEAFITLVKEAELWRDGRKATAPPASSTRTPSG